MGNLLGEQALLPAIINDGILENSDANLINNKSPLLNMGCLYAFYSFFTLLGTLR